LLCRAATSARVLPLLAFVFREFIEGGPIPDASEDAVALPVLHLLRDEGPAWALVLASA